MTENGKWFIAGFNDDITILRHKETGEQKTYDNNVVSSEILNEILTLTLGEDHGIEVKSSTN